MKAAELRRELREFIFWTIMERNFPAPGPFNPDDQDWHLLGDAMSSRKDEEGVRFPAWWQEHKKTVLGRWCSDREVIDQVYEYLDGAYFKETLDKKLDCPRADERARQPLLKGGG